MQSYTLCVLVHRTTIGAEKALALSLANGLSLSDVGAVGSYVSLTSGLSLPGVGTVGSYVQYFWPMVSVCLV